MRTSQQTPCTCNLALTRMRNGIANAMKHSIRDNIRASGQIGAYRAWCASNTLHTRAITRAGVAIYSTVVNIHTELKATMTLGSVYGSQPTWQAHRSSSGLCETTVTTAVAPLVTMQRATVMRERLEDHLHGPRCPTTLKPVK